MVIPEEKTQHKANWCDSLMLNRPAAAAVDQQAENGRRRNAAEKEKYERLAADLVDREMIAQTVRNASKRPRPGNTLLSIKYVRALHPTT